MSAPFVITIADHVLLAQLPAFDPLRRKLEHAIVVSSEAMPADVATMNSRVRYTRNGEERIARLAYPASAGGPGMLSILTAEGAALLGLAPGQSVEHGGADGARVRVRLEEVLEQPERALHRRNADGRLDEGLAPSYPASGPLVATP